MEELAVEHRHEKQRMEQIMKGLEQRFGSLRHDILLVNEMTETLTIAQQKLDACFFEYDRLSVYFQPISKIEITSITQLNMPMIRQHCQQLDESIRFFQEHLHYKNASKRLHALQDQHRSLVKDCHSLFIATISESLSPDYPHCTHLQELVQWLRPTDVEHSTGSPSLIEPYKLKRESLLEAQVLLNAGADHCCSTQYIDKFIGIVEREKQFTESLFAQPHTSDEEWCRLFFARAIETSLDKFSSLILKNLPKQCELSSSIDNTDQLLQFYLALVKRQKPILLSLFQATRQCTKLAGHEKKIEQFFREIDHVMTQLLWRYPEELKVQYRKGTKSQLSQDGQVHIATTKVCKIIMMILIITSSGDNFTFVLDGSIFMPIASLRWPSRSCIRSCGTKHGIPIELCFFYQLYFQPNVRVFTLTSE